MDFLSITLIALGLAMDACAVSISCGLTCRKHTLRTAIIAGSAFGFFQGIMPVIGYFIGCTLKNYIEAIDHWIAFILLVFIGLSMIKEGFHNTGKIITLDSLKVVLTLSIATSIDALATGVSFSFLNAGILLPALFISTITFITCFLGVILGKKVLAMNKMIQRYIDMFGGFILIAIGTKILFEHLLH